MTATKGGVHPLMSESMTWLLDRMPEAWRDAARPGETQMFGPGLEWHGAGRAVRLWFTSPHEVIWESQDGRELDRGRLNVGLNLHDILGLVRWCVEG